MRNTTFIVVKKLVSCCIALMTAGIVATGGAWAAGGQEAKLLASDAAAGDRFGNAVALEGDTALVGAFANSDNGQFTGSAYVFVRAGNLWTEQAKLLPAEAEESDNFGWSVALQGDRALIGAWGDDNAASVAGAVYEFTREDGVWSETAKLVASDGSFFAQFSAVDFDGQAAVIGARGDDETASNAGAAYIFKRMGGTWSEQVKLLASDGESGDRFGSRVAIDGNTVLIAAQDLSTNDKGAAYVFVESNGVWSEQAKLLPSASSSIDNFGHSVALEGDTAVVGSPDGSGSGDVYVFTRSNGVWSETAGLVTQPPAPWDGFGHSVALRGDTLIVGNPFDGFPPGAGSEDPVDLFGSVSVFERTEDVWVLRGKLLATDDPDGFGVSHSIDLSGDSVLVGAQFDAEIGTLSGAAYVFRLEMLRPVPAVGRFGALLLLMAIGAVAYFALRRSTI